MLATLLLSTALLQDAPQTTTYRDKALGLSFEHPKNWKVTKSNLYTLFEIPLGEGKTAQVQMFSAVYRDTAERWQSLQAEVNAAMERTVDRQWEEELLGVPMLLTRLSYVEGDRPTVTLVGLLYSATPEKMQFRLNAPAEQAESAQELWWTSLLSLRTSTGLLPGGEDPSRPLSELQPQAPKNTVVLRAPERRPENVQPGIRVPFGGAAVQLLAPWKVADDARLTGIETKGNLTLSVHEGNGDVAGPMLEELAATALAEFRSVGLRKDSRARLARSGATVASVWRRGTGEGGPLVVSHTVGVCGNRFWMLRYRGPGLEAWEADRAQVEALVESLYVEAAG